MGAEPDHSCVAEARARLAELSRRWAASMSAGRYAEGWRISDAALAAHAGIDCSRWPRHEQFLWDGTAVEGRRVLVRCYRGFGDTLQMARFLPRLRERASHVTVWAPALLHPLLARIGGMDRLEALHDGDPGFACDVDLEICELAHLFRVRPAELRRTVPYLRMDTGAAAPAANASRGEARVLQVGLVWQTGGWDPRRCVPWPLLRPLATVPRVRWLILQRGPGLHSWGGEFGELPPIADILEEARCLAGLDLLVSVDTFSAHLAGAMGVPVWLLLHSEPDWRWGRRGLRSPWYPAMRLLRQPRAGAWNPVLQRLRRSLEALALGHGAPDRRELDRRELDRGAY